MWIVRLALNRPYTFAVMGVVILVLGFLSTQRMSTDIFPEIDIPVISMIWTYRGMSAEELEKRVTTFAEFAVTSNVNDIRKVESQTVEGVAVIKIYFHPNANIGTALAQVTSVGQAIRQIMPPGIQPPIILRFNASSVPIIQLSLSSKTLSESDVYDFALWRVRQQLSVIQGQTIPSPYGGKERQIQVDIDPQLLQARGISPQEVSLAVNANNLAYPTGSARIDTQQYPVSMNNTPLTAEAFNNIPIKYVNDKTIYLRDVAQVRDGFQAQTTVVRRDGNRGALVTVLKNGGGSTLDIVKQVKEKLPDLRALAPKGLDIDVLFDQSVFVEAAVSGVVHESIIAGLLTATMILLFLASWRSTLIVAVSIPLAILSSILALYVLGYTLNVMTLGGLALAVGILVDDATVEVENIHRNVSMNKPLIRAILDGAAQIAAPTFVATLTICIVFVSVLFLEGPSKFLFTPMALSVVFAMLASYLLSRTVVPMLANYLLPAEVEAHHAHNSEPKPVGIFGWISLKFEAAFEAFRATYVGILEWNLRHRLAVFGLFLMLAASAAVILPRVGQDFFPSVDTGQFRLHVRAPAGTRLEETEVHFTAVEEAIRTIIPKDAVELVLDNIGLPNRSYTMAFGDSSTTGSADGEILVALKHDRKKATPEYIADLRRELPKRFPNLVFYFQASDIVSQILNFGIPSPIDVQIAGLQRDQNYQFATEIASKISKLPGVVDVHVHQVTNVPKLHVEVDQTRALQLGFSQQDIAQNVLVSLSGSQQVQPNYWVDPKNGISYPVETREPIYRVDSLNAIDTIPIVSNDGKQRQLLSNFARIERGTVAETVNHVNVQPTFDVYANVQGTDLGSVVREIEPVLNEYRAKLGAASTITLRGQAESMNSAFIRLGFGIAFAALLVYLLMVVNFQSWLDPFIIITALPGALTGIVWMLFLTHTTFSVPSLMGTIMSIGVATANSILLVTFANDVRQEGDDHRYAPDVIGSWRRRRAERAARPRRHRRPDARYVHHPSLRPGRLQRPAPECPSGAGDHSGVIREVA